MWKWVRSMKGQKLHLNGRDHWFSVEKTEYELKCSKMTGLAVRKLLDLPGVLKTQVNADYRRVAVWYLDHRIAEANVNRTIMQVNTAAWEAAGLTTHMTAQEFQGEMN